MTDREVKQRLTLKLGSLVKERLTKNNNNKRQEGLTNGKSPKPNWWDSILCTPLEIMGNGVLVGCGTGGGGGGGTQLIV